MLLILLLLNFLPKSIYMALPSRQYVGLTKQAASTATNGQTSIDCLIAIWIAGHLLLIPVTFISHLYWPTSSNDYQVSALPDSASYPVSICSNRSARSAIEASGQDQDASSQTD